MLKLISAALNGATCLVSESSLEIILKIVACEKIKI